MPRVGRFVAAGAGLSAFALYQRRRQFYANWLGLPPMQNDVTVERNIAVTMPDGINLMTDHYRPKKDGTFPTILIRTPYGRGREAG